MKIVQLCPYDMARPGGVQRHVRDLSEWLNAQGHETRIVAPPSPGHPPHRRENITEIGRARSFSIHGTAFELSLASPRSVRALADEMRDWGADLVHMHTPWTPLVVAQMWRALRLPSVTTIHATLPRIDGLALTDRYIRFAAGYFMRRSRAVIIPSQAPLAMLRQLVPGLDTSVLPPCVDLSGWRAGQSEGGAKGPVNLAFLGRLEARKGIDIVLDTWRILAARLPDITLTIGGDGALRSKIEAAVHDDPKGRLRYVGRPDNAAARALIGGAEIVLAPAPYGESFGIVLAEAMAAGTVPIAAANEGYSSVMTGLGAELLVAPGDAVALAAKVEDLALNPGLRAKYRDWGMVHSDAFDVAGVGPAYLDLFRRVVR